MILFQHCIRLVHRCWHWLWLVLVNPLYFHFLQPGYYFDWPILLLVLLYNNFVELFHFSRKSFTSLAVRCKVNGPHGWKGALADDKSHWLKTAEVHGPQEFKWRARKSKKGSCYPKCTGESVEAPQSNRPVFAFLTVFSVKTWPSAFTPFTFTLICMYRTILPMTVHFWLGPEIRLKGQIGYEKLVPCNQLF